MQTKKEREAKRDAKIADQRSKRIEQKMQRRQQDDDDGDQLPTDQELTQDQNNTEEQSFQKAKKQLYGQDQPQKVWQSAFLVPGKQSDPIIKKDIGQSEQSPQDVEKMLKKQEQAEKQTLSSLQNEAIKQLGKQAQKSLEVKLINDAQAPTPQETAAKMKQRLDEMKATVLKNSLQLKSELLELKAFSPSFYKNSIKFLDKINVRSTMGRVKNALAAVTRFENLQRKIRLKTEEFKAGQKLKAHKMALVQKELRLMKKEPKKWYNIFLKQKKIEKGSQLFQKMQDPQVFAQMQRKRFNELKQRKIMIQKSVKSFVRIAKQKRASHIKQYTDLLKTRNELFSAQNTELKFHINNIQQSLSSSNAQKTRLQAQKDDLAQKNSQFKQQAKKALAVYSQKIDKLSQTLQKEVQNEQQLIKQRNQLQEERDALLKQHQSEYKKMDLEKQALIKAIDQEVGKIKDLQNELQDKNIQVQQLSAQYDKDVQFLKSQAINFQINLSQKYNHQIRQLELEYSNRLSSYQQRIQSQKQAYEAYIAKVQKQNKDRVQILSKQIDSLKAEDDETKMLLATKQAQMQVLRVEAVHYKRVQDLKLRDLKQQYDKKLAQQQLIVDLQAKQLAQFTVKVDKLIKQNKALQKQLQLIKSQNAELLAALQGFEKKDQIDVGQIRILTWVNPQTDLVTIRQCFRHQQGEKWIATIRGVSFSPQNYHNLVSVFTYWWNIRQNFPFKKEIARIPETNLLSILDLYKNKRYFGLRQGFWKDGELLPTRRGINIQISQLANFLQSIQEPINIMEIQNY